MQECNRSQKVAICMVGLPARGKTYISRRLNRYLSWLGYNSRVFNVGHYRRQLWGTECDSHFFDPKNEQAVKARSQYAILALDDLCNFLKSGGDIALLDGTNPTKEARKAIQLRLLQLFEGIQILWIESICDREDVIKNNIEITRINNPDFEGKEEAEARQDIVRRIQHYERIYEPIHDSESLPYLKIINICENINIHKVKGYLLSKVISYAINMHIYHRPVYLSRHGESVFNQQHRVGGDSDLSPLGELYADKLGSYLLKEFPSQEQRNEIILLTSTMRRAVHTTEEVTNKLGIKYLSLKTLDEINTGICDGLTYEEIAEKFPNDFQERKVNKLTYRYPRGESYLDLISRIEPVIFEIERSREPVVVIAHQAILRCLYAYFHQNIIPEVPELDIPLHCVIKLVPSAYYCEESRIKIDPHSGEVKVIEESFATITQSKSKNYIDL